MLDAIYTIVTPWAVANRKQILKNRVLGRIVNYIYPIYCKLNLMQTSSSVAGGQYNEKIVVSLTSYPARISKVYLCINTLLRQNVKPERIILWLAESQFPNRDTVPKNLLELQKKGLEIRFCEDLRSYKKVFFTAQEYMDRIIVTADDDTLYPESWIKGLMQEHKKYPECVVCYRAHMIRYLENGFAPYKEWTGLSPGIKGPEINLIPVGVGGVLYPKYYFKDVCFDKEIIKKICPTVDDLWLKILGFKKNIEVVKVNENSKEWFTIRSSQKTSLMSTNVGENCNDVELALLIGHYKINPMDYQPNKTV